MEATIGFNKREAGDEDEDNSLGDAEMEIEEHTGEIAPRFESTGKLKWTSQDHKFLRALKISTEEDESR